MINDKVDGNNIPASSLLEVLLALKQNTMKDLQVADIYKILSINNRKYYLQNINDDTNKIYAITIDGLSLHEQDVVLVLFTNTDYKINISRLQQNQKQQNIKEKNFHNFNYGIIIGKIDI